MPKIETGTRTRNGLENTAAASSRAFDRGYTRDVGMTKQFAGAVTFAAYGANGTVIWTGTSTGFVVNDTLLVEGCNLNNGSFLVQAVNVVGGLVGLVVTPSPSAETAANASLRAA